MDKTHRTNKLAANNCPLYRKCMTVVTVVAAVVLFVASCNRPVIPHAQFIHLTDSGWLRQSPLVFHPVYDDSTRTYDISLALRHQSSYEYGTLPLAVDVVGADSVVHRQSFEVRLADVHGNWSGGGFGSLYQVQLSIACSIKPCDVSYVSVWQTLDSCECLLGISDVGIICKPTN